MRRVITDLVPLGSSDQAGWPPRASAHCRISAPVFKIRDISRSSWLRRSLSDAFAADQADGLGAKQRLRPATEPSHIAAEFSCATCARSTRTLRCLRKPAAPVAAG